MTDTPRFEETGFDPGILQDLERGAIPKGWEDAAKAKEPRMYYGYNSLNICCRHWLLLGWPQEGARPKGIEETERGRMRAACPKCGADIWFDLSMPDMVEVRDTHQPPCIVGGVIYDKA
jgi:hypothetical protein